jgi:hypothetical protein
MKWSIFGIIDVVLLCSGAPAHADFISLTNSSLQVLALSGSDGGTQQTYSQGFNTLASQYSQQLSATGYSTSISAFRNVVPPQWEFDLFAGTPSFEPETFQFEVGSDFVATLTNTGSSDGSNSSYIEFDDPVTVDVTTTPEPSTFVLVTLGTLGMLARKRAWFKAT